MNYKKSFTNTKNSIDVELENLFSLLHNLKTIINICQSILNESKLVAKNLGGLAEFTTIRQRKRKCDILTISGGSLK
jgi:DNA polymerase III sliding clamp (beta) subunit (PCNA family)